MTNDNFEKLGEELEKLKMTIAELAKMFDEAFCCVKTVLDRIFAGLPETFAPVFCIGLPCVSCRVAPLWRTSRAYYRPSEKAGSARIQLFAKEGVL